MKNLTLTTMVICLAALAISCSNNQHKYQMAYSGTVTFNKDSTVITGLSKNGFVSYTQDDDKIVIESDNKGGITYSFDGDDKQTKPENDKQKVLLNEATYNIFSSERSKANDPK